jgi:cell division septum initiation protein DivIVA
MMLDQMRKHEDDLKSQVERLQRELAEKMEELAAIGRAIQAYRAPKRQGRLAAPLPSNETRKDQERQRRSAAGLKGSAERWRRYREAKAGEDKRSVN